MAILADDLQFYQSERLTDATDAGGFATANVVFDNVDNNLFPDIASGDRIAGRAQLRKCFAAVRSPDDDVLMGVRVYVASPPTDSDVTVSLIAGATSDELTATKTALENGESPVYGIMTVATEAAAATNTVTVDSVYVPVCPAVGLLVSATYTLPVVDAIPARTGHLSFINSSGEYYYRIQGENNTGNPNLDSVRISYIGDDGIFYEAIMDGGIPADNSVIYGYFTNTSPTNPYGGPPYLLYRSGDLGLTKKASGTAYVSWNLDGELNVSWTGAYHSVQLSGPVYPGSVTVTANAADNNALITAEDDEAGKFDVNVHSDSTINYDTGMVYLRFNEAIKPETLSISYQIYYSALVDPEVIGLDPAKFPNVGKREAVRVSDFVIVQHLDSENLTNPVSAGATYPLARSGVQAIWLEDATGTRIAAEKYTTDLTAGTVTMANPLDLSGYTQPLVAYTALQDESMVIAIDGNVLTLNRVLKNTYPADESTVSSMILAGDLYARVSLQPFAQQAWTSVWSDSLIGNEITPQYNDIAYPIVVANDGAITERWRIQFTGSTTVNIIGETVGQITSSPLSITTTIAPTNPFTGNSYFTISEDGWGSGWVSGNLLRFNTAGAELPLWAIRCVQASDPPLPGTTDRIRLAFVGDVDA